MTDTKGVQISADRLHKRQAGMALLVVLWTVSLLVLLVIALSNTVQVEVRTATYRKEAAQAYAVANGGVEAAIFEIAYPPSEEQKASPIWNWHKGQMNGLVPFEGARARLKVVNEAGKLDLNHVPADQLEQLFESQGLIPARAHELADALGDWRSPPKSDERESDATSSRERAHHALFNSMEEALRVPGMTRGILYGSAEVDPMGKVRQLLGAGRDLTVRSGLAQLNINYASEAALRSVPGIDMDIARAMISERAREPFKAVGEINDRISRSLPDEALPYLTTAEVNTYTIVSTGELEGSAVRRTVEAVVQFVPEGAQKYRILSWYDDKWNE
jgi:general secretion pathway protein K